LVKNDKGATLELPYGIEGFCTGRNLQKEDGGKPEVGETLDFKVIEFSKGDKRILLSHTATYKEDEKPVRKKAPKKAPVKNQEATSSLGDLEALSNLKDQMEDAPKKKAAPKAKKEEPAKTEEAPEVAEEKAEKPAAKAKAEEKPAEEAPAEEAAPEAKSEEDNRGEKIKTR
jgi:small subunit ribosomal protein S1